MPTVIYKYMHTYIQHSLLTIIYTCRLAYSCHTFKHEYIQTYVHNSYKKYILMYFNVGYQIMYIVRPLLVALPPFTLKSHTSAHFGWSKFFMEQQFPNFSFSFVHTRISSETEWRVIRVILFIIEIWVTHLRCTMTNQKRKLEGLSLPEFRTESLFG